MRMMTFPCFQRTKMERNEIEINEKTEMGSSPLQQYSNISLSFVCSIWRGNFLHSV